MFNRIIGFFNRINHRCNPYVKLRLLREHLDGLETSLEMSIQQLEHRMSECECDVQDCVTESELEHQEYVDSDEVDSRIENAIDDFDADGRITDAFENLDWESTMQSYVRDELSEMVENTVIEHINKAMHRNEPPIPTT